MEKLPLHTARLILRRFIQSDLAAFIAYRNQPEVARYQSWLSFSEKDALDFFREQEKLTFNMNDTWFQIAVLRQQDAVLMGDVAVHFFDEGRQAELGVTFDIAYQRLGYAAEAMSCVIEHLFLDLNKHRIIATVDVLNKPVQHLLEKLGFSREAHYKENIFFKGSWSDEYSYALLNHKWKANKNCFKNP